MPWRSAFDAVDCAPWERLGDDGDTLRSDLRFKSQTPSGELSPC